MAYVKNTWVDQDVQRPKTYEVTNNQDGSITLTDSFGIVTELGTPVNATNMNHIEDGIEQAYIDLALPAQTGNSGKFLTTNGTSPSWASVNTHALKSYEDAGELLTDNEGLNDVTSYAHSTFDLSKFTKVGSPTVTDDGIASGFSTSNYVKAQFGDIDLKNISKLEITTSFKILSSIPSQQDIFFGASFNYFMHTIKSDLMRFVVSNLTDSPYATIYYTPQVGDVVTTKCILTPTKLRFEAKVNGVDLTADEVAISTYYSSSVILNTLIFGTNAVDRYFNGQIDLKQFSIRVNGVPVFSGNQTGIDTIKPDDYTVVGTPTISADGVASGFSSSNYISASVPTLTNNNSWEFVTPLFKVSSVAAMDNTFQYYSGAGTTLNRVVISWKNDNTILALINTDNYTDILRDNTLIYTVNDTFQFKFIHSGNQYTVFYRKNNSEWILLKSVINSASFSANTLNIGINFNGSADLNSFKIYVDGSLVYQPCLKIPYTESKTGSKVVDSYYRPRVTDMAEQFGSAPYYTLSDSDFTLPQGELYGFYEKSAYYYLPDWNNRILIKQTILGTDVVSSYTAPENGYIAISVDTITGGNLSAYINSLQRWSVAGSTYNCASGIIIPVKKGDVYSDGLPLEASALSAERYFIPVKGV